MRDHSRDYYDDNYIDGRYPAVKAPAREMWDDEFWDDDDREDVENVSDHQEAQDRQYASRRHWEMSRAIDLEDRRRRRGVEIRGGEGPENYYDDEDLAVDESSWEVNRYLRTLPVRETTKRLVRSEEAAPEFEDSARSWRQDPQSVIREQERIAQEEAAAVEGPAMPLTIVLLVTTILLTVLAGVGRFRGYRDVSWDWRRMPLLSVVFSGLHDDITPIAALMPDAAEDNAASNADATSGEADAAGAAGNANDTGDAASADGSDGQSENAAEAETTPVTVDLTIPDGVNDAVVQAVDYGVCNTAYLASTGTTFEPLTEGIFAPNGTYLTPQVVDTTYFHDALFIGDSRTDGLYLYGNMKDDAYFWCKEAMSIYDVFDMTAAYYVPGESDGTDMTLEEALGQETFRKIYVSIGINELGTSDTMRFYNQYQELISYLREQQPDALIYIQGIMHVSASYSQSDAAFNNTNIVDKNTAIASLANGRDLFYLDMNDKVCDENGDLLADLSNDGLHLKASAYQLWKDDLLEHAFVRDDADWTAPEAVVNTGSDGTDAGASGHGTGKPESDISSVTGLIVQ